MNTFDLFINKVDCCGCGLCSQACTMEIIEMVADEEGFLYPKILHHQKCINCGLCIKVCPMKSPGRPPMSVVESYGGHFYNIEDIKSSSSGGYATAISREFIKKGGIVYGVRYSRDFLKIEYSRASNPKELEDFRTSKYVQANKGGIYKSVRKDLVNGHLVLFIGLPCEVSALYHFVGKLSEKLYTISLICHGPSSPKVHRDYCENLINKYQSNISFFSVRHKEKGWKPYYTKVMFENGKVLLRKFKNSEYEIAFQYMKRPSCSICKYKYGNKDFGLVSDVTIGDFHAVTQRMIHYNSWGVSQACVQSVKGKWLVDLISSVCVVEPIPTEKIERGNIAFVMPIPPQKNRGIFVDKYLKVGLQAACGQFAIRKDLLIKQFSRYIRATLSGLLKF